MKPASKHPKNIRPPSKAELEWALSILEMDRKKNPADFTYHKKKKRK